MRSARMMGIVGSLLVVASAADAQGTEGVAAPPTRPGTPMAIQPAAKPDPRKVNLRPAVQAAQTAAQAKTNAEAAKWVAGRVGATAVTAARAANVVGIASMALESKPGHTSAQEQAEIDRFRQDAKNRLAKAGRPNDPAAVNRELRDAINRDQAAKDRQAEAERRAKERGMVVAPRP